MSVEEYRLRLERIPVMEQVLKDAEAAWAEDPSDPKKLGNIGDAMLRVAQMMLMDDPRKKPMLLAAISKLEQAVVADPNNTFPLWSLGCAHITSSYFIPDTDKAASCFDKAEHYFTLAHKLEPDSHFYRSAIGLAKRAPEHHAKKCYHEHALAAFSTSSSIPMAPEVHEEGKENDVSGQVGAATTQLCTCASKQRVPKYQPLCWAVVGAGIAAAVGFAIKRLPRP